VAELKCSELDAGFDSKSKPEKGRWIVDVEPRATIPTTNIHPSELEKFEEG